MCLIGACLNLSYLLEIGGLLDSSSILALADGSVFKGLSIGIEGETIGEVVFNTALTGYQEILTDPSYARQIVTLTYPHIGNVGVTPEDEESDSVWAQGLIIRDLPLLASNFRSTENYQIICNAIKLLHWRILTLGA